MPRVAPKTPAAPEGAPREASARLSKLAPSILFARLTNAGRDALPLLILGLAIIGVPVLVFEPQGLPRLRALERDVDQVEAENRALEREIARLRGQVRLLKDDLGTVEHVARTEYGLIRKSEIVLQLPKAQGAP
jgi:cell division protein FtsB